MKKKVTLIIAIILVLLLLFPFPVKLKDGGSVEYKAILYSVTDLHRLSIQEDGTAGYEDGLIIEILGMKVYNSAE